MAIFWEMAAPIVYHKYVLFIFCLFVVLVISHFGFEDRILALVPVPGHCLLFTFR